MTGLVTWWCGLFGVDDYVTVQMVLAIVLAGALLWLLNFLIVMILHGIAAVLR